MIKKRIKDIEQLLGKVERRIWRLVFHFPYKKLLLLLLFTIFAYTLFKNPYVQGFVSSLGKLELLGVFIAGILFTFGFTTPLAVGFFVVLNPANPLTVALIGGIGSMVGDLLIFSFIKVSFMDEFKKLEKTKLISGIKNQIKTHLGQRIRLYLLYFLAGVVIASPLPDEAGVMMLAGLTTIKAKVLAPISLFFNSLGIFILCII